ncbi:MAG: spore coat protein [Clostridia bacterium]|nr:spore coat protein [Clostridia bacterium]
MMLNLTQKERMLLEDQKSHEEICVQKYHSFANQVQDPQLRQLLHEYGAQEQQHLQTINQILAGQMPALPQQGPSGGQTMPSGKSTKPESASSTPVGPNDALLLNDLLMTEKYVSGTYDTAIFEFTDSNIRQILNHIQKEEQQHGEGIFQYMQSHGLYNPH